MIAQRIGVWMAAMAMSVGCREVVWRMGEPSDIDIGDRRYLVEDARRAVQALAHAGIDVFGVGLDAGADSYLTHIFGRRNVVRIGRVEQLPEKLPMLYLRLTA